MALPGAWGAVPGRPDRTGRVRGRRYDPSAAEITFDKRPVPGNGGWSYDFRHRSLDALGRILLQDLPGRGAHVSCEAAGDPADPRTAKRRAIFEPLGLEIARQRERATGPDTHTRPYAAPSAPNATPERVNGKLSQCRRCGGRQPADVHRAWESSRVEARPKEKPRFSQ